MRSFNNSNSDATGFVYFPSHNFENAQKRQEEPPDISKDTLDKLLNVIGREVLREKTPTMQELEQSLQDVLSNNGHEENHSSQEQGNQQSTNNKTSGMHIAGKPTIKYIIQKGYLKESNKWLSSKGFVEIGGRILNDVMKALKTGDSGSHSST